MQMRVREKERVKEKWLMPEWTIGKRERGRERGRERWRERGREGGREGEREIYGGRVDEREREIEGETN